MTKFLTARLISDVNECELAVPRCQNGATCKNSIGDYECECTEFWTGKDCNQGRYMYNEWGFNEPRSEKTGLRGF